MIISTYRSPRTGATKLFSTHRGLESGRRTLRRYRNHAVYLDLRLWVVDDVQAERLGLSSRSAVDAEVSESDLLGAREVS